MANSFQKAGILLLGVAVGLYLPAIPAIDPVKPYMGFIALVIAVILFVKG